MLDVMACADKYLALSRAALSLKQFAGLINDLTELKNTTDLDVFVDQVLDRTGYRQMGT